MSPRGSGHRERTRPQAVGTLLEEHGCHQGTRARERGVAILWLSSRGLQTAVAKAAHQTLPALGRESQRVDQRSSGTLLLQAKHFVGGDRIGWWGRGGVGWGWNHSSAVPLPQKGLTLAQRVSADPSRAKSAHVPQPITGACPCSPSNHNPLHSTRTKRESPGHRHGLVGKLISPPHPEVLLPKDDQLLGTCVVGNWKVSHPATSQNYLYQLPWQASLKHGLQSKG